MLTFVPDSVAYTDTLIFFDVDLLELYLYFFGSVLLIGFKGQHICALLLLTADNQDISICDYFRIMLFCSACMFEIFSLTVTLAA